MITINSGADFLALTKVADFKYKIKDFTDSPVSNLKGWKDFASKTNLAGLRIFNDDGSVTFSFLEVSK